MAFGRTARGSLVVDAALGAASGLGASWVTEKAQGRLVPAGGEETRAREPRAQGDLEPAPGRAAGRLAGAALGALFGLLARRLAAPALLAGTLYGIAVWLFAEEALGLPREPWEHPGATGAGALGSHLVYGTATAAGVRLLGGVVR